MDWFLYDNGLRHERGNRKMLRMQSTVSRKNWFTHIDWMNGKKSEAAIRRCFVKKVFLKISQNSQENT